MDIKDNSSVNVNELNQFVALRLLKSNVTTLPIMLSRKTKLENYFRKMAEINSSIDFATFTIIAVFLLFKEN